MRHCRTVDDARSRLMSIERLSLQISKETLVSGQPLYSGVMRTVLVPCSKQAVRPSKRMMYTRSTQSIQAQP